MLRNVRPNVESTKTHFIAAISKPGKKRRQRRGEHGGIVYLFSKKLNRGELHIAAEIFKNDCFFITGY